MVERFVRDFILAVWLFHLSSKREGGGLGIDASPTTGSIGFIGSIIIVAPTSAFTVAPLAARKVERLVQRFHFSDFHACRPKKSKNRPENRVFGLVEPIFSIFRPFSAVIFIFRGIARTFSRIFPL